MAVVLAAETMENQTIAAAPSSVAVAVAVERMGRGSEIVVETAVAARTVAVAGSVAGGVVVVAVAVVVGVVAVGTAAVGIAAGPEESAFVEIARREVQGKGLVACHE